MMNFTMQSNLFFLQLVPPQQWPPKPSIQQHQDLRVRAGADHPPRPAGSQRRVDLPSPQPVWGAEEKSAVRAVATCGNSSASVAGMAICSMSPTASRSPWIQHVDLPRPQPVRRDARLRVRSRLVVTVQAQLQVWPFDYMTPIVSRS